MQYLQQLPMSAMLVCLFLLIVLTGCSNSGKTSDEVISFKEANDYMTSMAAEGYLDPLTAAYEAKDYQTMKAMYQEQTCECYSKMKPEMLNQAHTAMFNEHLTNDRWTFAVEKDFVEQYQGNLVLVDGCKMMQLLSRIMLGKMQAGEDLDTLLDPSCQKLVDQHQEYKSMVDSMQPIILKLEMAVDKEGLAAVESEVQELFKQAEKDSTLRNEAIRKAALLKTLK